MFTQFTFKNFKSFRKSTLPVSPVTLIIGANASGKSNALEGINFLSRLTNTKVKDILTGVRGQFPGIRGGSEKVTFPGEDSFGLECVVKRDELHFKYTNTINIKSEIAIVQEKLICTKNGKQSAKILFKEARESDYSILLSVLNLNKNDDSHELKSFITGVLQKMLTFDPIPAFMKDYVPLSDFRLKPNAENVSATIAHLLEKPDNKQKINQLLQDFPEQQIEDIDVVRTSSLDLEIEDVMLVIKEKIGSNKMTFNARNLSDGTLRYLAIITAFLSEPVGTTLTIEDIDAGIHPARLKKLFSFISEEVRKKEMSLIATTHNPALLNSLPREDIPGVVICYRDYKKGDSRFIRLVDLPTYPELMAEGRLGDLLTQGAIEKAAHESEVEYDKKVASGLKWFKEEFE